MLSARMRVRVCEANLQLIECTTRIPFRFGISTLTGAPLALLRLVIETAAGERATGCASDLLVPKWFEKDLAKTPQDDVAALTRSTEEAVRLATAPDHSHYLEPHRLELLVVRGVARLSRDAILTVGRGWRSPLAAVSKLFWQKGLGVYA